MNSLYERHLYGSCIRGLGKLIPLSVQLHHFLMGHGVGPYLGLDEIGSSSSIIIFIIISYLFNCTF